MTTAAEEDLTAEEREAHEAFLRRLEEHRIGYMAPCTDRGAEDLASSVLADLERSGIHPDRCESFPSGRAVTMPGELAACIRAIIAHDAESDDRRDEGELTDLGFLSLFQAEDAEDSPSASIYFQGIVSSAKAIGGGRYAVSCNSCRAVMEVVR